MKDVWEAKPQRLYAWVDVSREDREIKDVSQFSDFGNWMDTAFHWDNVTPRTRSSSGGRQGKGERRVNLADGKLNLKIVLVCSFSPISNWLCGSRS